MKKIYLSVVLIIIFFISISFSEDKIGYIDSQKIINGYKGISNLKEQLNKLLAEWEKEAQEKKLGIDTLKNELKNQELMLSEETKRKKRKEIEQKETEYEQFIKEIWGEDGKSKKKHEEILKPVIEEISNALEKIGEEEGYTIIFDISEGNIVFVKTGLDLTDRILYEINKEFSVVSPETEETKFYVFLFDEVSAEAESKSLGRQISAFLKAGLDKFSNFEFIESKKVSEAMISYGFIKEEELNDNQVRLVSRRIEANIVVFGKIDISSGTVRLKLRWINFEKGNEVIKKDFSIDEKEKLEKLAQDVMTYLGREIKKQ